MKHQILNLIGKNCMTPDEGQKIYNLTHSELLIGEPVELDFTGVNLCATTFLNFAIGKLLQDIQPDKLEKLLKISNLDPVGKQVLKRVLENSKKYYSDHKYRQIVDDIIHEKANNV
jgi:STAS-like domain of unknown function (DUF4325)